MASSVSSLGSLPFVVSGFSLYVALLWQIKVILFLIGFALLVSCCELLMCD